MVAFSKAEIRKDENGKTFLDLEIRGVAEGQQIIIRNTFPAASDYEDIFLAIYENDQNISGE